MSKITKFTNKNITSLENQIVELLNEAGLGIEFTGNTRSYGSTETTFKIVGVIDGAKTRGQAALESAAKHDGIDITKVGPKGEILVDYHPRKFKMPYIMRRGTSEFKLTPRQARQYFAA